MDRALDSARRVMDEYEAERSPEQPKDSPRARIAQNLKRQIDTVSERWSMLSHRSEDWQQWIDEVLRVSACCLARKSARLLCFVQFVNAFLIIPTKRSPIKAFM